MSEVGSDESMDVRGVLCPLNFVKIKLRLEEMAEGEMLEVVLDDGAPMRNVPRSLKEEGHRIVKVERLADNAYRLMVQKGES